ncbi:signal peptide peptidase-like 2B [Nephila pilipes]|uniref:Signal peptide peptidase-like 2B n=1 Tax=Nephila pilipes TaxID=299642 RepID=A0A8X6PCM5_NEPPI|nr:signal peptide peptidase-like 2B [Nephila pilipes]
MISITIPILWVIFHSLKYAWILQNVLCMTLCVMVLKILRFSSYKVCTLMLCIYFCVDIILVLITPHFTKDGKSVMGEVATGGNEDLFDKQSFMEEFAAGRKHVDFNPLVFQVMDIGFDPLGACTKHIMGLGLGDVVLPGLLLSYCHAFDLMTNKKGLYYCISLITYGLGLLLVEIAIMHLEIHQPALLYIVPAILIPPIVLAWFRKELSFLWHGFKFIGRFRKQEIDTIELTASTANIQPTEIHEKYV